MTANTLSEDELLQGLSLLAQVLYLRCIRPAASSSDYASTGFTYKSLAVKLAFSPSPGSTKPPYSPTTKALRCAISELVRAGLVERVGGCPRQLNFRLLAVCDSFESDPAVDDVDDVVVSLDEHRRDRGGGVDVDEVVHLYHSLLPKNPAVRVVSDSLREDVLSLRELPVLSDWDNFFQYVARSRYLTGGMPAKAPYIRPFSASLHWLVKRQNFSEICDGQHHVFLHDSGFQGSDGEVPNESPAV